MKQKKTFMNTDFTISQENHDAGWTMPYTHYHDWYELYILEKGTRIITIDGREYAANPYDITLFQRNVPHSSRGETPFSGICIHIAPRFLDLYFTPEAKKHLLRCFHHAVVPLSEKEFFRIKQIADTFPSENTSLFFPFVRIMDIINKASRRCEKAHPLPQSRSSSKARSILNYVEENYIFINSLSEIAEQFQVSESYLYKIFRQHYNTSPKKYLYDLKLNNACYRLENQTGTIRSIAAGSGFTCYEYFSRLFKEKKGCTPSEYRRQHIAPSTIGASSKNAFCGNPLRQEDRIGE